MKLLYSFLSTCFCFSLTLAQTPCESGRFADAVFSTYTTTSNLVYGQNLAWNNNVTTLKLDFYEPAGDTMQARPLIIWVHGGSFIGGSKTDNDVKTLSQKFAQKGYACASIDYRLGFFPIDSANAVKAVVRAVQDLKAAIRYFYADAQASNTYKIDTNRIFIGGSSAGAIAALHVAYLNDPCEISAYLNQSVLDGLGGLEGTSGNPGYSTKVAAVLNGCGALAMYSWLEAGDVPLCSFHGTADNTVKYNRGIVNPGTPLMYLDGSRMLHERACALGVPNKFYTFIGAGHVPYLGNSAYMDTSERFVRDFLLEVMGCTQAALQPENARQQSVYLYPTLYCDGSPVAEICSSAEINEATLQEPITAFPNPSSGHFSLRTVAGFEQLAIYNAAGQLIFKARSVSDTQYDLDLTTQEPGIYFLQLLDADARSWNCKVSIVH
jgi:hypothetical protein